MREDISTRREHLVGQRIFNLGFNADSIPDSLYDLQKGGPRLDEVVSPILTFSQVKMRILCSGNRRH